MKVALVIEWIDPWRGGAETSTSQFVRHLLEHDVELTIVTRSRLSPTPGMKVHTLTAKTPLRARQTLVFGRKAAALVHREQFDLVHAITACTAADLYEPRGGTVAESIQRNLALRRPGMARQIKQAANRLNHKQRLMLQLERRWLTGKQPPPVIAISDYVARQLREHYDYPPRLIHKVFNGVDPDLATADTRERNRAEVRRLYRVRDDELLVIMVAHNFKLKGLSRWLEAAERLAAGHRPVFRSLVIGKDSSMRWERVVKRQGLDHRVQFIGSTRRIASFYHAADILVHPTYYDPCSRVVLEAMAAGLPVMTTQHDGAAEIIRHGVTGLILEDANCVQGLIDGVLRLTDLRERQRMGAEAQKTAESFTMQRHAEGVFRVYQAVLAEKRQHLPQRSVG